MASLMAESGATKAGLHVGPAPVHSAWKPVASACPYTDPNVLGVVVTNTMSAPEVAIPSATAVSVVSSDGMIAPEPS